MLLSNGARKGSTLGEITNLMAVDAQKFVEISSQLNLVWSAPLQVSLWSLTYRSWARTRTNKISLRDFRFQLNILRKSGSRSTEGYKFFLGEFTRMI